MNAPRPPAPVTTRFAALPRRAHAQTSAPACAPWGDAVQRILCIRPDNLGDVLMMTPALHALREGAPHRRITLLTSPAAASLTGRLDDVAETLVYEAPWVHAEPSAGPVGLTAMRERLAAGRFDAAVIFTAYSQSALPAAMLCYAAGIPRRLAWSRENPYALLTDWVRETEPHDGVRHEVERQLALVAAVGARGRDTRMRFAVNQADRDALAERLAGLPLDAHAPWIVLHPGASAASRRYPPGRFGEIARRLVEHGGYEVLITGSAGERPLAQAVARAAGPAASRLHELCGALPLGEFAALLDDAALLISNNSGPVHLASALGTPVVDLYALTNPQHTPWQTPHRVLYRDVECRWCYRSVCPQGHHECLLGVSADEVMHAALALLEETSVRRAARGGARLPAAVYEAGLPLHF